MPKVYKDGEYIDLTDEEYAEQYPQPEHQSEAESVPTATERIAALEAAVAEIALREAAGEVQSDV